MNNERSMTSYEELFQSLSQSLGRAPDTTKLATKLATEITSLKEATDANKAATLATSTDLTAFKANLRKLRDADGSYYDGRIDGVKKDLSDLTTALGELSAEFTDVKRNYSAYQGRVRDAFDDIRDQTIPALARDFYSFKAVVATGIEGLDETQDDIKEAIGEVKDRLSALETQKTLGQQVEMTLKLDGKDFQQTLEDALEESGIGDLVERLEQLETFQEMATDDIGRLFGMSSPAEPAEEPVKVHDFRRAADLNIAFAPKPSQAAVYGHLARSFINPGMGVLGLHRPDHHIALAYFTPDGLRDLAAKAVSLANHLEGK